MKINCMFHDDTTASMHLYETHAFCFGCSIRVPREKLGPEYMPTENYGKPSNSFRNNYQENLEKSIERINALPKKTIRGFELPFDSLGYYIVYPSANFYLRRIWDADNSNKYRSPAGHRKPLFIASRADTETLYVVEGQLNAMTLAKFLPGSNVVSPGAATDFANSSFLNYYLKYRAICIIVDKDAAGVVAGLELKEKLLMKHKKVLLYPMQRDLNDIYVNSEKELTEEIEKAVAMLTRLSGCGHHHL